MEETPYKIIVADEKGYVYVWKITYLLGIFLFYLMYFMLSDVSMKKEEIKRVINLLKDESSDHLTILEDLNKLYDNCLVLC